MDDLTEASVNGESLYGVESANPGRAGIRALTQRICAAPDYRSFHLLFALKQLAPREYCRLSAKTKAAILVSNLEHVSLSNAWGCLTTLGHRASHDVATQALISLGPVAIPYLEPLLQCADRIDVGGHEGVVSEAHQWRKKDYAYRFIKILIGQVPLYDASPEVRDELIDGLKEELSERPCKIEAPGQLRMPEHPFGIPAPQ